MTVVKKGALQCALVEAVGTFLLALTVFQTSNPLAIGLVLMAALYIGSHAHVPYLNTAVSFAEYFGKKIDLNAFLATVAGQVVGAVGAAVLSSRLGGTPMLPTGGLPVHMALMEAVTTFVFVMVVMTVLSNADRFKNSDIYGLVIGFTATGLVMLGGGLALFNPAIALAVMVYAKIMGVEVMVSMPSVVVFVLVPLVASVLAVWFHEYVQGMKK